MVSRSVLALACTLSVTAYDPQTGMALAKLEQAVYCGADRFNSWNVGDQLFTVDPTKVRYIKDKVTEAVAGVGSMSEPRGCFVAVQGTEGTVQSIIDGVFWTERFKRDSCDECWVHAGWHQSYESIKGDVFQALQDFGCQGQALYMTGHSLGAAVLHYLLYDAVEAGYQVASALAMESPRPGDSGFSKALQSKVEGLDAYRVTHYQDIVVHLPPPEIAHYEHALPEIYYGARSGTDYQDCGMDDDTTNCSNQWKIFQLTGDDHCWFSDINPCGCSASIGLSDNATVVI